MMAGCDALAIRADRLEIGDPVRVRPADGCPGLVLGKLAPLAHPCERRGAQGVVVAIVIERPLGTHPYLVRFGPHGHAAEALFARSELHLLIERYERHEHAWITGPNAHRGLSVGHSHAGGSERHAHPDTGPAHFTIGALWQGWTGIPVGRPARAFTSQPDGPQLELAARVE